MSAPASTFPIPTGGTAPLASVPNPMLPPAAIFCIVAYTADPNGTTTSGQLNIEAAVQSVYADCNVVWSANTTDDDNYAFIAQSPDNQFFLAVRGSLPFYVNGSVVIDWGVFANWILEDFDMASQQAWNYTDNGDTAYIASGSQLAFSNISSALNAIGTGQETAADFLNTNAVAAGYPIYITGHSLGGNIANVYASFFANQYPSATTYLFTFAAPAAGDQTFADDLSTKFPAGQAYHYAIDNDIVPVFPVVTDAQDSENVQGLVNLFVPQPLASTLDFGALADLITGTADFIQGLIDLDIINPYVHAPQTSAPYDVCATWNQPSMEDWFLQAAYQHDPYHYLSQFVSAAEVTDIYNILTPATPKLALVFPRD